MIFRKIDFKKLNSKKIDIEIKRFLIFTFFIKLQIFL